MTGRTSDLRIFGDDYPTPDGTCIRDYVHVCDLADAHVLGLKKILAEGGQHIFNLGNGNGYSVKQVIEMAESVTGRKILSRVVMRRPGDPPVLVASSQKVRRELSWQPRYQELSTILKHAWAWHQTLTTT